MATTRDQQRLMKMDAEIMELKYLFERELREETMSNKTMFLGSRAIQHKLSNCVKARNLLCASMKNGMGAAQNFQIELAQRKEAVRAAEDDLMRLHEDIKHAATVFATLKITGDKVAENAEFQYKSLCRELPKQERRVRDKERALNNWLMRGREKSEKEFDKKLPKFYNVKKDINFVYGQLPSADITNALARPQFNIENPVSAQDFIAKAASEYKGVRETEAQFTGIDYTKIYSEGYVLMNNQPATSTDIDTPSEGRLSLEFKEPEKDNSSDAFKKYLKNRIIESEDTDVPTMPPDTEKTPA